MAKKKRVVLFSLITVTFSLFSNPASAAVKAGSPCPKVGKVSATASKTFTCIKSGKKFVWNKGIAVTKPASSTPAPSVSPAPQVEPLPAVPTSFADLVTNYKGISVAVWQDVRNRLKESAPATQFEVLTGPKTSQPKEKPSVEALLSKASSLFSTFAQPKVTKVFYFNRDDVSWAQEQHGKLTNPKFRAQELSDNCPSNSNCGAFGSSSAGVGAMFMGVHLQGLDPLEVFGGTEIHEFTHVVQYSFYSESVFNNPNKYLPGWFIEGQASAIQQAGGTSDYADYLGSRRKWFSHSPKSVVKSYSAEEILNFFELQGPGKFDQGTWSHVYDIGSFATEALIAIGGLDSTFELIKHVSFGKSFDDAFLATYKIPWDEAKVIIAEAVSREYGDAR
ncbi:hypothetical protein MCEMRE26_00295 [Candidatus Nanopelagicaceae bacterium]